MTCCSCSSSSSSSEESILRMQVASHTPLQTGDCSVAVSVTAGATRVESTRDGGREIRRRSRLYGSSPLLVFLGGLLVVATATSVEGSSEAVTVEHAQTPRLRSSGGGKESKVEHMHVIRRLYGKHAHDVRDEIDRRLERKHHWQTGLPSDPDFIVPYHNHPFDPKVRARRQLSSNSTSNGNSTNSSSWNATTTTDTSSSNSSSGSLFQPIRIQYYTAALDSVRDSSNGAKIDWIKNVILPKMKSFWESALSVVPVQGRLRINPSDLDDRMYCGDTEFTQVPDDHISTGVADTDLLLYVSASSSSTFCPQQTLAVAVPCNFDQFDRPIAGNVNICLGQITLDSGGTATDSLVQSYVDVTVHEAGHVLGMSSNSFRFFWDPDTGKPRTPRPFQTTSVTCVDGTTRSLIVPSTDTLAFDSSSDGNRWASIVTPKVRQVVRNQFDCQDLNGAQLENQDTRAESCTGDHWDERLYYPEAMTAVISPTTNIMSGLSLALMEDSGWYKANYTQSRMSPWGLGAGCNFVRNPCLTQGSSGPELPDYSKGFFCNTPQEKACSNELTTKLACTVMDYYFFVPQNLPPSIFQYFPDKPTIGGPRQADYCPLYGSPYGNKAAEELDCTISSNAGSAFNTYNEAYGSDSKCIPSSSGEGRCYKTACVQDSMSLRINVGGKWFTCTEDFQEIEITVEDGSFPHTLTCPRLSQACPDLFCPFQCAGRGICNYKNIVNGTIRPKCECFDSSDKSPGCSDSLIPNGGFLNDGSGLMDNLQQNFFDPLIAVFVDNPDVWTTASYAWAAGLITICVLLLLCICSSFWPQKKKKSYSY